LKCNVWGHADTKSNIHWYNISLFKFLMLCSSWNDYGLNLLSVNNIWTYYYNGTFKPLFS